MLVVSLSFPWSAPALGLDSGEKPTFPASEQRVPLHLCECLVLLSPGPRLLGVEMLVEPTASRLGLHCPLPDIASKSQICNLQKHPLLKMVKDLEHRYSWRSLNVPLVHQPHLPGEDVNYSQRDSREVSVRALPLSDGLSAPAKVWAGEIPPVPCPERQFRDFPGS